MQTDLRAPHLGTQCPGRGQLRGDVAELRLMASQAHGTRVHQAAGMSTVFPSSLCSRGTESALSISFPLIKRLLKLTLPCKQLSQSPSGAAPQGDVAGAWGPSLSRVSSYFL